MSGKIVVTGLGWATQFGCELDSVFDAIYEGKTAVNKLQNMDHNDGYCKIAAPIIQDESVFPWAKWAKILPKPRASRFIIFGLEAAERALLDANLISQEGSFVDDNLKIGVIAGSGIGGLDEQYVNTITIKEKGVNRVTPFFVPSSLINLLPGHIAIRHKIKGPNQSQVAACSTGAISIADGARMIKEGRCDIVLVGAAEGAICPLGMAGFAALRALASGYNDDPASASRPFDKKRSGFVMGEGAGMLILETEESAKKRGAKIYCEYLGAGLSNDANHITAPIADGSGAANALTDALHWAGKKAHEIDYINAHATSTELGDKAELTAFKKVFGDHWPNLAISSIKGAIGHMLGAAGSVEAIACVLCLHKQKLLPTLNLHEVDEAAYHNNVLVDLVPLKGKQANLETVLSTSFGFGGHNVALIFGKY